MLTCQRCVEWRCDSSSQARQLQCKLPAVQLKDLLRAPAKSKLMLHPFSLCLGDVGTEAATLEVAGLVIDTVAGLTCSHRAAYQVSTS